MNLNFGSNNINSSNEESLTNFNDYATKKVVNTTSSDTKAD